MKPGYLTTEFWATLLVNIGSVTTALTGALPAKWSAILSTVSVAVYALARALTKTGSTANVPPIIVPVQPPANPANPGSPPAA